MEAWVWRREGDSNPRYCLGTHAFQACALNHSAISPPHELVAFIVHQGKPNCKTPSLHAWIFLQVPAVTNSILCYSALPEFVPPVSFAHDHASFWHKSTGKQHAQSRTAGRGNLCATQDALARAGPRAIAAGNFFAVLVR